MQVSDTVTINSFARWEQAFWVFSNIFTSKYPQKSGELIQYNHIIHSIAQFYTWENVYAYDKEFRIHMARHHPHCSWAVILQQAWSMKLRDRISHSAGNNYSPNNHQASHSYSDNSRKIKGSGNSNDYCKRFNKGKCNLGSACRYEHRCTYCHKFGHGVIVCRKLIFDREKSGNKKDNHDNNRDGGGGRNKSITVTAAS